MNQEWPAYHCPECAPIIIMLACVTALADAVFIIITTPVKTKTNSDLICQWYKQYSPFLSTHRKYEAV